MLLGHTGFVTSLEYNPLLPDLLLSTSTDGSIKVWNLDTFLCELTMVSDKIQNSATLATVGGVLFCFSGGINESVLVCNDSNTAHKKVWDVTNKKFLYELSAGNNHVISVAWDANENSLVAVTDDWRMSPSVGHWREGTSI